MIDILFKSKHPWILIEGGLKILSIIGQINVLKDDWV